MRGVLFGASAPWHGAAMVDDVLQMHGYAAVEPGPRLVVLGGVHGDDVCGTLAIERVLGELACGQLRLARGELTLVPVANPLARRRGQREGQRNLNRSFRPSAMPADYEARLTNLLCPVLARHDVLLDLHSFQSAGEPFAMIGPRDNAGTLEPFARAREEGQLAAALGVPCVVESWLEIYAARLARLGQAGDDAALAFGWGTKEYMRSVGGIAVTLECGQHRDPAAPETAYRAIHAALHLLGMSTQAVPAPQPAGRRVLQLADVTDRLHAHDRFERDWVSFDPVRQGQTIGVRADGQVVVAERDGYIVFPNAEAGVGSEWFYTAVDSARVLDDSAATPAR